MMHDDTPAPAPAGGGAAPCRKIAPPGRLHGKVYYLSFVIVAYPVETVAFDATNNFISAFLVYQPDEI